MDRFNSSIKLKLISPNKHDRSQNFHFKSRRLTISLFSRNEQFVIFKEFQFFYFDSHLTKSTKFFFLYLAHRQIQQPEGKTETRTIPSVDTMFRKRTFTRSSRFHEYTRERNRDNSFNNRRPFRASTLISIEKKKKKKEKKNWNDILPLTTIRFPRNFSLDRRVPIFAGGSIKKRRSLSPFVSLVTVNFTDD